MARAKNEELMAYGLWLMAQAQNGQPVAHGLLHIAEAGNEAGEHIVFNLVSYHKLYAIGHKLLNS
ncbi:MAG TPA: hypothetical protein VJ805_05250 [Nitrospiraceae bacterium]|nr:hypothetical protein [Nitrospiraceae bacterium]